LKRHEQSELEGTAMTIAFVRISLGFMSLLALANASAAQSPTYQLLDLGEPVGQDVFYPLSAEISAGGQIVTLTIASPEGQTRAREWDAQNGWRDITGPSRDLPYTKAAAVNATGAVVGLAYDSSGSNVHAIVWIDGVTFDLNALGILGADGWILEYARAITDNGMILGRGTVTGR